MRGSLGSILLQLRPFRTYLLVLHLILHISSNYLMLGPFSIVAQNRLLKLLKRYCNNLDVKLAFSSFKIRNMFSVKDPVPVELRSNVVYKLTCASCISCYVGKTSRHLSTRIRKHLNRDRTSHIFQHI